MKKSILVLIMAAQVLVLHAQKAGQDPFLTQSFPGKSISQVRSQTSGGNITITGSEAEARVEMFVLPAMRHHQAFSKEEMKTILEKEYIVTIEVKDNTLVATAEPRNKIVNRQNSLSISFRIYAPKQAGTLLKTSGGNISMSNLNGNHDFTTSGGNLSIDQLTGKIDGRTSGGNISFKNCADDINLSTSGGNIDASNSKGKISIRTSGGNITLNQIDAEVDATTSGGDVRADGVKGGLSAHTSGGNVHAKEISGNLDASTSGGNIRASLIETGQFVKLGNSGGNIDLELPVGKGLDLKLRADKITMSAMKNFDGTIEKDHVEGKLNGGGVPVTVRGGSGRLSVTLK